MIIKREFLKVKGMKMLSDKAIDKAVPAMLKQFECDSIASICYIGDGVYTLICCTSEKTELDPQEAVRHG